MSVSWRHRLTVFCASFLLLLLGAGNALAEPVRNAVNAIDADILFIVAVCGWMKSVCGIFEIDPSKDQKIKGLAATSLSA